MYKVTLSDDSGKVLWDLDTEDFLLVYQAYKIIHPAYGEKVYQCGNLPFVEVFKRGRKKGWVFEVREKIAEV